MIIPDTNLLLYAYNSDAPHHAAAKAWWEQCLNGSDSVGLPDVTIFAFLRQITRCPPMGLPLSLGDALRHVESWLAHPRVRLLPVPTDHFEHTARLLRLTASAGNLVTDAQLAALALAYNAVIQTNDKDFLRFPGLRWHNPLTGRTGKNPSMED